MDKNICNICGGSYVYKNGKWICSCCDNVRQDEITNEELVLLANAATKLRMADFDSAEELYLDFVKKYPKNSEGYWGLLLSKYGIKYEDDFDGKKIPTVYATSIESVLNDENYKKAIALADKETEKYYKQQANKFESIRQEWVQKASKEQPVEIFICYKDSDEEKDIARTDDSYEAQNLYTYLMSKGYSVFFSRESLRDKVAERYEPYIFNALNTAHVMIVYSSSKEYLESTWVKNEWTRFLKKIKNKQKQENSLILAFDKMKPSDFPKVFSNVQCMNASQKTFYSDLEKHIQKVIKKATAPIARLERVEVKENVRHKRAKKLDTDISKREIGSYSVEQLTGDEETQLKTAYKFLNRGLFADADEIITKILDKNSRNGQAILCKLLINLEAKNIEDLENHIDENVDFDEFENSIGYSNKDVALQILSALKNACINEFNADNNEFALQLADFVCKYNVEDVNFNNRLNEVITHLVIKDEIECADKLVRTFLRTLTDNTDSYLEEVENTIDIFKKQGHFDIASKYVDEYLEIYPTSHKMLWKKISIDLKCKNEVELTHNIFKLEDVSVFEKILECTKVGQERDGYIEKLLNIIQKCAEELTSNEDFSKCCDVFDKIIKYTTQNEKYVKLIFRYAENCQEKGQFTHAEKYYAIVIGEDERDHNAYWKLLQSKLKVKNNKELIEQPVIITTLSEFHSAIVATGEDEKSADRYIDLKAKQLEYIEKQKILRAKKKQQKKIFTIVSVCFSLIFMLVAGLYGWGLYKEEQSQLLYTLENGTYSVRAGKFYDEKNIKIPSMYKGKPVTEIDENAFKNKNVEVISIPNSVEIISDSAFYGCNNLTKVEYYSSNNNARVLSNNSSMKKIGDYAFYDCTNLEDIQLSNSLTYLGKYAFANCSSLNEITIPSSLENILEGTFKNAFNSNVENISIPKEVEFVGKDAFDCNVENILVDERNSIPTDWANNWFNSDINVKYSLSLNFVYNGATSVINKNKISVVYGEEYYCPIPSKLGYSFAGWFYDVDNQDTQITGPDGVSIKNWDKSSSQTVYARWIANNNTLIFNGNGATSGNMSNYMMKTGESSSLPNNEFVKNGYTFVGWSTTSNGSVKYIDGATYLMGVNSTYNLYAIWQANINTLTFNGNGPNSGNLQVWGSMSKQRVKTDEAITLPSNAFIRNGYKFIGWSTTSNGSVVYRDSARYTMGPNDSYTLYAKWEPINYTITLELNGGSYDGNTVITYNAETETFIINEATREGYTFNGWTQADSGGSNKTITILKGTIYNKVYSANWIANTNKIIFNGNGHTFGSMENQEAKTDETVVLNKCEFVKEEYLFVGWSTSPEGTVLFEDGDSYKMGPNETYVLYAQWILAPAKIIYNSNGATSGEMTISEIDRNTSFMLPENKYLRNGYEFIGWSTTSNGEVIYEDKSLYEVGNNLSYELFAIWEANTNQIIFNGNGFTSGNMDVLEVKTDATVNLPNNSFVKDFYEFIGWSTTSNGEVVYEDSATYIMGPNSSYTLYAIWQERIRTLSTVNDLAILQSDANNGLLATYELKNNIDLNGAEWEPVTEFKGIFNGNGYSIHNFKITQYNDNNEYGFIQKILGKVTKLSLDNINISLITENQKITSICKIGILSALNAGEIKECYTSGKIEMDGVNDTSPEIGGFIGYNKGNIFNSYSNVDIDVNDGFRLFGSCVVGGFVGKNISYIKHCYSMGSMTIYTNTGGQLIGCSSYDGIGGFVGTNAVYGLYGDSYEKTSIIEDSFTTVNLDLSGAVAYYSRFVGYNGGTINNSYRNTEQICKYNGEVRYCNEYEIGIEYSELSTDDFLVNTLDYDVNIWNISEGTLPVLSYQSIVTFDSNSGTGTMFDIPVQKNLGIELPDNLFEKELYDFKGWSTAPDGEVEYVDGDSLNIGNSNILRLYAVWQERIKYISTVDDLKSINDDYEDDIKYSRYLLVNDITIEGDWTPILYTKTSFKGHFDGCGFTISNKSSNYNSGIFHWLDDGGIIKNLIINNQISIKTTTSFYYGGIAEVNFGLIENCKSIGYIISEATGNESYAQVGGLASMNYGTIKNCYSDVDIKITGEYSLEIGGIAGQNESVINNCFSKGSILAVHSSYNNAISYIGGIVGSSTALSNCFSIMDIQGSSRYGTLLLGAIAGVTNYNTVKNCCLYKNQSIKSYTGDDLKTLTIKQNIEIDGCRLVDGYSESEFVRMNFNVFISAEDLQINTNNVWKIVDNQIPILYYETPVVYNGNGATSSKRIVDSAKDEITIKDNLFERPGYEFMGWSLTSNGSVDYVAGQTLELTQDEYILYAVWKEKIKAISTVEELKEIATCMDNKADYNRYVLTNNITIDGEWQSLCTITNPFNSTFDGGGYSITFKPTNMNYGLFKYNSGTIKNLLLKNEIDITTTDQLLFGSLVYENNGVVINCKVSGTISIFSKNYSNYAYIGGFVAYNNGLIKNSYSDAAIQAHNENNGINCGSIAAESAGTIQNCYTTGNIEAKCFSSNVIPYPVKVGGIAGAVDDGAKILNCFSVGTLQGIYGGEPRVTVAAIAYTGYAGISYTINNCYRTNKQSLIKNDLQVSHNISEGNPIVDNELTKIEFVAMQYLEFVSEDYLLINENNVWILDNSEYPKLYWEN